MNTAVFFFLFLICLVKCFYLPGFPPTYFSEGDDVPLKVNKLTSVHTQLPYKYYYLPYCKPDVVIDKVENLGEILKGDRIENSLYELFFKTDSPCKVLVSRSCPYELNSKELRKFYDKIRDEYKAHLVIDNLPGAMVHGDYENNDYSLNPGFPIGFTDSYEGDDGEPLDEDFVPKVYLNNHLQIKILYHYDEPADSEARIVGFHVYPKSIDYSDSEWNREDPEAFPPKCLHDAPKPLEIIPEMKPTEIIWTYSVEFEESELVWSERWEPYFKNPDGQIHWFSIVNSFLIVLFLTGMVAMIMTRTLHADFRRYNEIDLDEEIEETGWKLVHGDVFRPPKRPLLLSVFCGFGVQVFFMSFITLFFALLGFLSPANRGGLLTATIILFIISSIFAGYSSTRLYKVLRGKNWKRNTMLTALLIPGIIFSVFFVLNLFVWSQRSSGAVPFKTIFSIVLLWIGVSLPLVFFGSYFAFKKPEEKIPTATNQIPRQVPEQVWYLNRNISVAMGGSLPFGAVFIELFFILSAVWGQQTYYLFTFLFIVFIIVILTSAEISIVMTYFQLCSENYHWWWRSYFTSGASAFYLFLYSLFYFFSKLDVTKFVSGLLFFGYTSIMSLIFFTLTGTIGFYASYMFVKKIYSSVKFE